MKKIVPVIAALVLVACCGPLRAAAPAPQPEPPRDRQVAPGLPIPSRDFLVGTAGYAPAHFPTSSAAEVKAFWKDVSRAGDLFGVHTDWKDTKLVNVSSVAADVDLVVVLGFQKPDEWSGSVEACKKAINDILRENRKVRYVAIGNEITLFEERGQRFDDFVKAYRDIYASVKARFPKVKVFTTFQLEALKGEGYLTGKAAVRKPAWGLISKFGDTLDIIGITTYPFLDYKDPRTIPDDYYAEIAKYSKKPIGFTEVGWPARERYGGKLSALSEQGYTGSQEEQARFLRRFLEITRGLDVEFVDWLFINDIVDWKEGDLPGRFVPFDSVGLRYHDGREKQVWKLWLELKGLKPGFPG